jgi:hypothetical protein
MPWTIIMQEQNNFGVVSLVEAKGVVIDIDKPAKKGKPAETITMKVGANVFIRHDAWKDAPSFDPKNLQGCIKVFYSSQHGSFSVQHPHRLEVNPATNERKMQEVKTCTLTRAAALRTLAENNIPAAFAAYVLDAVFTAGQKKNKDAA